MNWEGGGCGWGANLELEVAGEGSVWLSPSRLLGRLLNCGLWWLGRHDLTGRLLWGWPDCRLGRLGSWPVVGCSSTTEEACS